MDSQPAKKRNQQLFRAPSFYRGFDVFSLFPVSYGNQLFQNKYSSGLVERDIELYSILQAPTTQFAKMSIDLKFVELTADVLIMFFIKWDEKLKN